jgi:WD40 repeat protein
MEPVLTTLSITHTPVQATFETIQPKISPEPKRENLTFTPTEVNVISPSTVANLVASDPLPLPEWPERLIWLGAEVGIPGNPSPRPSLLANSGLNLYPVVMDPLSIGEPIPLPLEGKRILDFSPDASSLVVQDTNQTGVYTMEGQRLWLITKPAEPYSANYSPDGRYLAVTSSENWEVTIYDVANGQIIHQLTGFETAAPVYNALISPGGKTLAYYARGTLEFQNVETGQLSGPIFFEDFIGNIFFSPDGQRLILYVAGKLMIYNPLNAELIAHLVLSESVTGLTISPDGTVLVGIYGQNLQFWDGQTLAPVTMIHPQTSLARLSFSPDGQKLVTQSNEDQLTIWHLP